MNRIVAILAAALAGAIPVAAQRAAPITFVLDKGSVEFAEPFTQAGSVTELRDGRLLVLDNKEKALRIVDFARASMSNVSRLGAGPLEYQVPGFLLRGASDTIAYYDAMQRRFLLLSPTGAPLRTEPFGSADPMAMLTQMTPAFIDAAGRVYGQTTGMTMPARGGGGMPTYADSVEVRMLNRRNGKTETVTRVRSAMASLDPKVEMGSGGSVRMTVTAPDFHDADTWAVLPDGRVAVLRNGIYRVHFYPPNAAGPETLGPVIPYAPVAVTAAEKKTVVDSMRAGVELAMKQMRSMGGAAMPQVEINVLEPTSWAAVKPPYAGLTTSPDGKLWVGLQLAAGTKFSRYDILDGTGALIAHVQLASGETLAGLGRGTLYTIRTDSDDLQYVRRYMLPAPLR